MPVKKLPDAEFEIMKAVWNSEEPVTTPALTEKLKRLLPNKDWKQQTVMTMLVRLEKKGFLRSEKNGKERLYYSSVSEEEYMKIEAKSFADRFNGSSFSRLVKALNGGEKISEEDIEELQGWLDKM
ncbi:MAG: BlaI/MecI/CopY family transcriptional regulator [Bacteroides sp.]|nr:BlaI/MecI/CopY family transcriptional regulator [Bacteroides sp.]